ncbi:hypothetical protein FJZ19_04835 [Candidatus Pacearchaeota archaeon]|nr:hypothetical protein [Candidatus Pacearchaeota archaeon]
MQEKENILRILRETKEAVKKRDSISLKILSNQTLHSASIYRDTDNIAVAVLVYALSKLIERKSYQKYKNWQRFFKNFMICIDRAIFSLENGQEEYFQSQLKCIRREISNLSGDLKKNIQDVFRKAEINKAGRIYEHGLSMQQTARLLGITIWELAEYAGQSGISDINLNLTLPVKTRIKNAMEMFEK